MALNDLLASPVSLYGEKFLRVTAVKHTRVFRNSIFRKTADSFPVRKKADKNLLTVSFFNSG